MADADQICRTESSPKAGAYIAPGCGMEQRGRLRDRLAIPTTELLPDCRSLEPAWISSSVEITLSPSFESSVEPQQGHCVGAGRMTRSRSCHRERAGAPATCIQTNAPFASLRLPSRQRAHLVRLEFLKLQIEQPRRPRGARAVRRSFSISSLRWAISASVPCGAVRPLGRIGCIGCSIAARLDLFSPSSEDPASVDHAEAPCKPRTLKRRQR